MSRFTVVVPETTQNFFKNSSFERWSSGLPLDWNNTTSPATISESVTLMRFGASAMRVVASGGSGEGMYQIVSTLESGSPATASVYAYVAAGVGRLLVQDSTGVTTIASLDTTGTGWSRLELPFTLPSTAVRVSLLAVGVGADVTFDGVQLEQKAYATTYADGSLGKGHEFIGEVHRSSSIRKSHGGRKKDIQTGITDGTRIDFSSGFGAGEPVVLSDAYGTLDGSYVNGVILPQRDLALGLTVIGSDVEEIQDRRKDIIEAFAPVRNPLQPLYLIHTANDVEKQIAVFPTGGINAPKFGQNNYEQFAATFTANDPFFRSPYDSAKQLGWSTSITATSILIKDNNGNWYTLPSSTNSSINTAVYNPVDPDELIIGGGFTTFNGVSANRIVRYRISTGDVTALGTGLNNTVNSVAIDVNGDIYAGGIFTADGSANAMNRIAKFAAGGSVWSTVGTGVGGGVNNHVYGVKFDNNRNLFLHGIFTATTAGLSVAGIAKLVSGASTITAAVTGLTTTTIWDIAFTPDNTLYLGGQFTFSGGANIAKVLDGTTTPIVMAGSLNSIVRSLWYDRKSNLLYIGGQFTTENLTSLVLRGIASWNGVAFTEVGNGVDSSVVYVTVDSSGNLIIYGTFTKVNGQAAATQRILKWNGAYWTQLDMELLSFKDITALGITPNGYLTMGTFDTATTLKSNAHTTVVNNGNAPTTAQFRFTGTGKLQSIKNETTGQQVDLNYTLATGEIVYLDFAVGRITATSSFRGNILNSVFVAGYDVSPFYLVAGNNDISVFINGTTSAATDARIIYKESYYSAD